MNKKEFERLRLVVGFPYEYDYEAKYNIYYNDGFEWFEAELCLPKGNIKKYGRYYNLTGFALENSNPELLTIFEWQYSWDLNESRSDVIKIELRDNMHSVNYKIVRIKDQIESETCSPSGSAGKELGLLGCCRVNDGVFISSVYFDLALNSFLHLPVPLKPFITEVLEFHEALKKINR